MSLIGQSVPRLDALGKVTGEALFPGDINMPEQAHMKILFAGRPHAVIRNLDTRAAESLPGVLAVLTAKDPKILRLTQHHTQILGAMAMGQSGRVRRRAYQERAAAEQEPQGAGRRLDRGLDCGRIVLGPLERHLH